MRLRLASLLVFVLLLVAGPAHSQGIGISWHNCVTLAGAAENVDYACDGSRAGDPYRIVVSFVSPDSLRAFFGIQIRILLVTDAAMLPDYWQVATGTCRQGALVFPADMTGIGTGLTGACRNPWIGANIVGGFDQQTSYRPGWSQLYFAIARDTPATLSAGKRYIAGVINLDLVKDIDSGTGICDGCSVPAALELSYVELYQDPGTLPQDIYILNGFADVRNRIRWQNCASCSTPTRKTTWGAVKATYR